MGALLIAAAALTAFAMAHHPSGIGHGASGLSRLVHGAMIALLSIILAGFVHFSLRRGLLNPFVLLALVAYGISAFAHVGAGTINGFIVPALAERTQEHDLFQLLWVANQTLAKLGVNATSVAFILWSAHLLKSGPLSNRVVALVGFAAGAYPIAALALGWLKMDVAGAFVIYAVHSVWTALVGVQLLRGKV
jgi:hypothetical protein